MRLTYLLTPVPTLSLKLCLALEIFNPRWLLLVTAVVVSSGLLVAPGCLSQLPAGVSFLDGEIGGSRLPSAY